MILESLKALVTAGRNALQTTCGLPVTCEHIQQVRQGTLTFPALGELNLKGAPIQHVHLGCDAILASQLSELMGSQGADSGISTLAQRFLKELLSEIGSRNPTGEVASLNVGPRSVHTRGLRTFGFRFETGLGQLFLLAEIPSKIELEKAKGSGFLSSLTSRYLPREWETLEEFDRSNEIDNFLIFLRKGEADVYFEIPRTDEAAAVHTGFLVEQLGDHGERLLKMTVDLASEDANHLRMGQMIPIKVGLLDRSLECELSFEGFCKAHVKGSADLNCMLFTIPEDIQIRQRRKAFRISVPTRINVEIECDEPRSNDEASLGAKRGSMVLRGTLVDLSFSGARVMCKQDESCSCLNAESKVKCRIYFPDNTVPLEVKGVIRRSVSALVEQGVWSEDIGLEFLVSPGGDSSNLDHIRQYVLAEQRSWLAQRIQVAGVDQW
jgi:hypothetical protein